MGENLMSLMNRTGGGWAKFGAGTTLMATVPYEAEVEYLRCDGNSWIDTGFVAGGDTTFEARVKITKADFANFQSVFGCTPAWKNAMYGFYKDAAANSYILYGVSNSSFGVEYPFNGKIMDVSFNGTDFKMDEVDTGRSVTRTYPTQEFRCPYAMALFAHRGGLDAVPTTTKPSDPVNIYFVKFYGAGVLERDFIPVRIGTVGYMYDKAHPTGGPLGNGLYPNSGSGTFTLGPDI